MKPRFTCTKVHWYRLFVSTVFLSLGFTTITFSQVDPFANCNKPASGTDPGDAGVVEQITINSESGPGDGNSSIFSVVDQPEVCDAHTQGTTVEGPDWEFFISIPVDERSACEATATVCRRGDFGGSIPPGIENEPVHIYIEGEYAATIPGEGGPGPPPDGNDCNPDPVCTTITFNAAQINKYAVDGIICLELRTCGGQLGNQPKETDSYCNIIDSTGNIVPRDGDYNDDGELDGNCVQLVELSWDVVDPIVTSCPGNETVDACTSDSEIQAAFTTWLEGFSYTGGCDLDSISPPPTPPLSCVGGTVTYNYVVIDIAQNKDSCQATFTVTPPPALMATCPPNENIPACTDSLTIEQTYAVWIGLFTDMGGCNRQVNTVFPPNASNIVFGGTITINHEVVSDCDTILCSSSFIVPQYDPLVVSCPADEEFFQCADQAAVNSAFTNWIAGFNVSGGCTPYDEPSLPAEAPNVCIGDTFDIVYEVTDNLGVTKSCTSSFKVQGPPALVVNGPQADVNLPACTDQSTVNTMFAAWLSQFTFSGGCPPYDETSKQIPTPQLCVGDTVVLNYMVTDGCDNTQSASSTFRLAAPLAVEVTGPADTSALACDFTDQADLAQAFAYWKNQFMDVEIGCGPAGGFVVDLPAPQRCTGGSVILEWTANDGCTNDSHTAMFSVTAPTQVAVSCPGDTIASSCDFNDQNALDADYNAWKAKFMVTEAGCQGQGSFVNDFGPPELCLDVVTVLIYQINDGCTMASCTASYTLTMPDPVEVFCPTPVNQSGCAYVDQDALDLAYADWKSQFVVVEGGCGATGAFVSDPGPPNLVTGGTVILKYGASDVCSQDTCESTFMVTPGAPVEISCPNSSSQSSCTFGSQQELENDFATWLGQFMVIQSGCDAVSGFTTTPIAPDRCEGGTVSVTFVAEDAFNMDSCTRTYTIIPTQVSISCPFDITIPTCTATDQNDINSQFNFWISQFTITNPGCGATAPDLTGYVAPDICTGGTVTINFNISDGCTSENCSRSFVVEPTLPLEVTCPDDRVETTCEDPEAAFRDWLAEFMVTGGCIANVEQFIVDFGDGPQTYSSSDDIPSIDECGTVSVEYSVSGEVEGGCSAISTSCSATFTVEPTALEVVCPPALALEACVDNPEGRFLAWAEGFYASGGCGALNISYEVQSLDAIYLYSDIRNAVELIPECGGELIVKMIVKDALECSEGECTTSFQIDEEEEELFLKCAPREVLLPCEYDIPRFKHWIKGFEWGGGCDLEIQCCIQYDDGPIVIVTTFDDVPAPNQCGEKLTITIKIESRCFGSMTCESSFEVKKSEPLTVSCPGDMVVPACLSDEDMEQAYQDWLDAFSHNGGCQVEAGFVGGAPKIPHYCGGTVDVNYAAIDGLGCNPDAFCTASFTVEEVQDLIVSCPDDYLIEECLSQEEIDAAYANWLEQFAYEGSCAKAGDFVGGIPDAPKVCGGTVEVTYKIPNTRSCFVFQTCTRSFTVGGTDGQEQIIGDISDKELNCNEPYPDASSVSGIDRCGKPFTLTVSEEISLNDSTCIETMIRTWTADSGCGQASSVSQKLTRRVDLESPELGLELEEEIMVNCGEVPQPEVFIPFDNCGIASFGIEEDTVTDGGFECPVIYQIIRTYYAIDECDNDTSFVQKINIVNEGGPVFINPPADLCDTPLSVTEYLLLDIGPLEVMNTCTGEITSSANPDISYDCMTNVYTITWQAMDECGNQSSYTQMICIVDEPPFCNLMEVEQEPCGGISKYTLQISGSIPPYTIQWEVLSPEWSIVEGENRAEVFLQTGPSDALVQATITDANGCVSVCTQLLSCTVNAACTFTETFYGNDSTELCEGASTEEVLNDILEEGPITIGLPGASFTIQPGDEGCVMELLGQGDGGSEAVLIGNGNCSDVNVELSDGASTNPLFNQLLTLALNMEYDPGLYYWSIQDKCVTTWAADSCKVGPLDQGVPGTLDSFCFSQVLLDQLGDGFKVEELKAFADSALAGVDMGVELSEITRALQFVNEAFSGCRIVDEFGDFSDISSIAEEMMDEKFMAGQKKSMLKDMKSSINSMILAPNPATTNLRVQLFSNIPENGFLFIRDQNGKNVVQQDVRLQSGENQFNIPIQDMDNGIYMIQYVNDTRYVIKKFMKVH